MAKGECGNANAIRRTVRTAARRVGRFLTSNARKPKAKAKKNG